MAHPPRWGFSDLAPATKWLLASGIPTTRTPPTAPLSNTAWAQLRTQAALNGLEGLLIDAVAAGTLPTDATQRSEVGEIELTMTKRRIHYEHAISQPLKVLNESGVDIRIVKGASLGALDYPDAQLRPTSDLDLVVRASQIRAATQALIDAGGRWINPEPANGFLEQIAKGSTVTMPSGLEVDMHRLLVWGPFGVRLNPDLLWKRSRPIQIAGIEYETLGLEETFVHICLHLMVLGTVKAREVLDVAQLAFNPDFNPTLATRIAVQWGATALSAQAVLMAERELSIPEGVMPLVSWARQLRPTISDRIWARTESPDRPLHGIEQAAMLIELGDWQRRAQLVKANFKPLPGTDTPPIDRLKAAAKTWKDPIFKLARR